MLVLIHNNKVPVAMSKKCYYKLCKLSQTYECKYIIETALKWP